MPHSTYLPDRMGTATLSPDRRFEAGSFQSFTLVYTAGYFGIDDTGSIKIVHRFAGDMGRPQWSDPKAPNYTTVEASNGAVLDVRYDPKMQHPAVGQDPVHPGRARLPARGRHHHRALRRPPPGLARHARADLRRADLRVPRPGRCLRHLQLRRAARSADDSRSSPARRSLWKAVLPTLRAVRRELPARLQGRGQMGQSERPGRGNLRAQRQSCRSPGCPRRSAMRRGAAATSIEGLSVAEPGDLLIDVLDPTGRVLCQTNPLRIVARRAAAVPTGAICTASRRRRSAPIRRAS